ncbi:MAG: hypothetical protein AAF962_18555 [Actinomycetota bacterium]
MPLPRRSAKIVTAALLGLAALGAPAGCGSDDERQAAVEIDAALRDEAQGLRGRHIEDGISWAEERGIEWRLTVIGDRVVDDGSPTRDDRISFQTDGDIIVVIEWS